ncbi:hypothetical protein KC345_g7433 [Hortaea werneckii]|nr:hypothetical protein KC345_g7433 [Hortaea werneckii]
MDSSEFPRTTHARSSGLVMPLYLHLLALLTTLWLGAVLPSTYDASGQYVFAPFNKLLLFLDLAIILLLDLRTAIVTAALGHLVGNIWAHVALPAIVHLQNIDDWSSIWLWTQVSLFFTMVAIVRREILLVWRCLGAFCLALRADDHFSAPEGQLVLAEPKGSSTSGDAVEAEASPQTAEPAVDPLDDEFTVPENLLALVEPKGSSANGDQAEALSPTEEQTVDFLGDFLMVPESRIALAESEDSSAADMLAEGLSPTAERTVAPPSDVVAVAEDRTAETSAEAVVIPTGVNNKRTMTRSAVRSAAKGQSGLGSLAQLIPGSFIRAREELEQDEGLFSVGKMARFARWHSRLYAHQAASQVFVWPASLLAVVDDDESTLERALPMPMDHEGPALLLPTADLPVFDALAERLNDWRGLETPIRAPCGARQTRISLPLDAYSSHVSPPSIDEYSTGEESEVVAEAGDPSAASDSASEGKQSSELAVPPCEDQDQQSDNVGICEETVSSDAPEEVADPAETASLSSDEDSSPRFEAPTAIEETAVAPEEPVRDVGKGSGEGEPDPLALPLYQPHVADGRETPASPVIAAETGSADAGETLASALALESPVESDQGALEQPGSEEHVPATTSAVNDAGHSASIPTISITAPDDEPEADEGTEDHSARPLTAAEAESGSAGEIPGDTTAQQPIFGGNTGAAQRPNDPENVESTASDNAVSDMQDVTPAPTVAYTDKTPQGEPEHASDAMEYEHSIGYNAPMIGTETAKPEYDDKPHTGFDADMEDADTQEAEDEGMEGLEWEDVLGSAAHNDISNDDTQPMDESESTLPAASWNCGFGAPSIFQQADTNMADAQPEDEAPVQVHSVSQPAAPQHPQVFRNDQNNGELVLVNPEDVARANAQEKTIPGITPPYPIMGFPYGSTSTQPMRSTWQPQPLPEASSRTTKRSHEDDGDTETPPGTQDTLSIAGSASESSSAQPNESSRRILVPKTMSGATKRPQDFNAQSSAFGGVPTIPSFTGTASGQSSTWASSSALGTSSAGANASAWQQQPVPEASATPAKRSLKSDAGQTKAGDVGDTTPRSLKELVATRERDQPACWSCGGKADSWNPLNLFQLCQDCAFSMQLDDRQKEAISNNFPCESCHKSLLADSDFNMGIDWLYRLCGRPACIANRQKQQPKKADASSSAAPAKQNDDEQATNRETYGQKKHKTSPSADVMVEDEKPLYPPLFDPDKNVEEKFTIIASEVDSLRDAMKEWRARVVDNQSIKDDVEEYRTKLNAVLICLRDDHCKPREEDKYAVFDVHDFGQACAARLDEIEKLLHKLELTSEDEVEKASIQALRRLVSNARNPRANNAGVLQKLRSLLYEWHIHNQRYSDALKGKRVMRYNFESETRKGYKKEVFRERE